MTLPVKNLIPLAFRNNLTKLVGLALSQALLLLFGLQPTEAFARSLVSPQNTDLDELLQYEQPELATTPNSMMLNLESSDLKELLEGAKQSFLNETLSGSLDTPLSTSVLLTPVKIEGLKYRFKLENLSIRLGEGKVHVSTSIKDLDVIIDHMTVGFFGQSCSGIPVSSGRGKIPFSADLYPKIIDKQLKVNVGRRNVDFSWNNFYVGQANKCQVLFGFNTIIKNSLPFIADALRPLIERSVEKAVHKVVQIAANKYDPFLQAAVTLPFNLSPIPGFLATMQVWPNQVSITPQRLRLIIGSDISFDRDPEEALPWPVLRENLFKLSAGKPSFFGISKDFIKNILVEANRATLLNFDAFDSSHPALGSLLNTARVARLLPDAYTRFDSSAFVSLQIQGAKSVEAKLHQQSADEIPTIELLFNGLKATINIDGAPYYHAELAASLLMQFGYDQSSNKMVLDFKGLQGQYLGGHFDASMTPGPTDPRFNESELKQLLLEVQDKLQQTADPMISLRVPAFSLGNRKVQLSGSGVRENYLTLDASVSQ